MRIVLDLEANGLENPTQIWCICCRDLDTGKFYVFRKVTQDEEAKKSFLEFASKVTLWVSHNWLGYDYPVLNRLIGLSIRDIHSVSIDTLIISKLVNYSRPSGHSIEAYGEEFKLSKGKFSDWSKYSQEMEDYCVRDVEICHRIFDLYSNSINDLSWHPSILLEHRFQLIVNDLHDNGFAFNTSKAKTLLERVEQELSVLDKNLSAFPPRLKLIREVHPRRTEHGTLHRGDFRWVQDGDLSQFNGGPFSRCEWVPFNPASLRMLIDVLCDAAWVPTDKTEGHKDYEREVIQLERNRQRTPELDLRLKACYSKLEHMKRYGYKVNEQNLSTLPDTAPPPAKLLAKRILLASRQRTLTEWLSLVHEDGRVRGKFIGLGAWTGRMAHQSPNTANITREFKEDGSVKFLGKELRQLWIAPKNRLLVGVDAEGIQLRIFAHYIDDKEFTRALVEGRKDDKTDPHSLNQLVLGSVCKTRQAAKRFIYALLLGAGKFKLSQVLGCSGGETEEALERLLERYPGFAFLKQKIIPKDAARGYFLGLDSRQIQLPGTTRRDKEHLCMSGYLQNGEAVVVKKSAIITDDLLAREKELKQWMFVNIVHDELQSETKNNMEIALKVAKIKADAIKQAGEELKLKCPMAGSYFNDDIKDYTIGTNWYQTH